ncbi:transcriptional regulator [Thermobifida cellulosilytica]|uniref:Transcriptional regulator n=1 Tax=Thermobifida cellulosilytica TB100 TaxID=665004 RepID=A0A147KK05_THECS|nr:transcriptional regulator [Thermobifida cellulosilytica]KUP97598.1 transcriptional regulator [Thermobifida cellulosilytica TB100]
MTDRPEQHEEEGGYYFVDETPRPAEVPPPAEAAAVPREPDPPEAGQDFRRTTPARVKVIRPERPRGHWWLISGTVLYVMCSAGSADYLPVGVRLLGHVLFWLALGAGLLVTVQRERIHGWEPARRWPWVAALICGTLAVEVLVAAVSSPVVIIGSAVVLSVVVLILFMLG